MGTHGQQLDGGLWAVANDDRGAFPISGSLPEPSTLTLLGIGMCGLLAIELIYRRRNGAWNSCLSRPAA